MFTGNALSLNLQACPTGTQRVGEARHPGPLTLSTSNPTGVRGKEDLFVDLGSGIHLGSETHLSSITMAPSIRQLKYLARRKGRHIGVHCGHPVPLRSGSSWAGTWSGVLALSDFKGVPLDIGIPPDIWQSGRIQIMRYYVADVSILVANVYGFPRGPTWPKAADLTCRLLRCLTDHLVIGYSGLAAICGDLNFDPGSLSEMQLWSSYGWTEVQNYAFQTWAQPISSTCKGATQRDQIWMSPALAATCSAVYLKDVFVGHSTVLADFNFEELSSTFHTWPRPQAIPWHSVDIAQWQQSSTALSPLDYADNTSFYKQFAHQWETSLHGFIPDSPSTGLVTAQMGRGQRTTPSTQLRSPPTCKAHRPGEASLSYSLPGRAVRMWYQQLRRLQSYVQGVRRAKQTPGAIAYRAELWASIVHARGFHPTFPRWWNTHESASYFGQFPLLPPRLVRAEVIYQVFETLFRQFEQWHLTQRVQILVSKRERSMTELFHDLRDPTRDQVDSLTLENTFTPLAFDLEGGQLHLDGLPTTHGHSTWTVDGVPLAVSRVHDDLLEAPLPLTLHIDSIIVQTSVLHKPKDVLHELEQFWKTRWLQHGQPSMSDWERISAFARAFVPPGHLPYQPVTLQQWRRSVSRFKPRAAKGVDGYGKLDLVNLSDEHSLALIAMLTMIENQEGDWPAQMLHGLVFALAKIDDPREVNHYRPVVLLSIIYRCWSSLRSRQILRWLKHFVAEDALGFIPSREPTQIWLVLQANIELALQQGRALTGISCDVAKAFNCIRRPPLFALAQHLGVPREILNAWSGFLSRFTRSFSVLNQVGQPQLSDVGFPEGCGLSVAAMAMLDHALHLYQQKFTMRTRTLSFVDNIDIYGHSPADIAMSFTSLRTFLDLWGLVLDLGKTYAWGTDRATRNGLAPLGFRTVLDAAELGGSLSFTAARRNRLLRQRGAHLDVKWDRLRRSKSPLKLKLISLPMVFWAKALHGASSCMLSMAYLDSLRTKAMKSLRLQCAGANSLIRFALSAPMTADPAYYVIHRLLFDFRRVIRKSPSLLDLWISFMSATTGRCLPGPFSLLVHWFSVLGWVVSKPPVFIDHDQVSHDLLTLDNGALDDLLQDAWLQAVCRRVCNRASFSGLRGLDPSLNFVGRSLLTPVQLGRLMAIHEGAFLSPWQQAKFDQRKNPICQCCQVPDTQIHWLSCRRYTHLRRDMRILTWQQSLDVSFTQHLLVPRSPWLAKLKQYFVTLPTAFEFQSLQGSGKQDIFIDGSCIHHGPGRIAVAAWAIINATTGDILATGPLSGIRQVIGRAEATALLGAATWALQTGLPVHVWCDSKFLVDKAKVILEAPFDADDNEGENHDLFDQLRAIFVQLTPSQLTLTWIPSHLDPSLCDTPFEEWVECWNSVVDTQAVYTNRQGRPPSFNQMLNEAVSYDETWHDRRTTLQTYYLAVASEQQEVQETPQEQVIIDDTDWSARAGCLSLLDQVPVDWIARVPPVLQKIPKSFIIHILAALERSESPEEDFVPVSFIELAFIFLVQPGFSIPRSQAEDVQSLYQIDTFFVRPTLAYVVSLIRGALRGIVSLFGLDHMFVARADRSAVCIHFPTEAMLCQVRSNILQELRRKMDLYTHGRGFRRASDLARPIPC